MMLKTTETCTPLDGGINRLQIINFDSNFYIQQIIILHLDVKVENGQLLFLCWLAAWRCPYRGSPWQDATKLM